MSIAFGGQNNFWRLKLGIGRPRKRDGLSPSEFIYQKIPKNKNEKVKKGFDDIVKKYFDSVMAKEPQSDRILISGSKKASHIVLNTVEEH